MSTLCGLIGFGMYTLAVKARTRLEPLFVIQTKYPKATNEGERPVVLLLYSSTQGGWHTGFWSAAAWRIHPSPEVISDPLTWLPAMLGPSVIAE